MRWSLFFDEFIEFEVGLSEVPIADNIGKNVVVNWKMFDGFEANKTFWTDSNGLEMQERQINHHPTFKAAKGEIQNISNNFYPVDSAIAMRDVGHNL